jgi:hypothetical protein
VREDAGGERDEAELAASRTSFERVLLHPHLEAELEWLRAMQETIVDAGLHQILVRKYCIVFNLVSIGLCLKLLFWDSQPPDSGLFWIAGFALANIATLGVYVGVAMSLASQRSILSGVNDRARAIDCKLNGDMAIGSAIDARIW